MQLNYSYITPFLVPVPSRPSYPITEMPSSKKLLGCARSVAVWWRKQEQKCDPGGTRGVFQGPAAGSSCAYGYTSVNLMWMGKPRVSYSCSENGLARWNGAKLRAE